MPQITEELFKRAGLTEYGGGLNAKQFKVIGINWPPQSGWKRKLLGKYISDEDAKRLVELKRRAEAKEAEVGLFDVAQDKQAEKPVSWLLRFDGSCDRNGHPDATGRWAFHIQDENYKTVATQSGETVAEVVTNNVSEHQALLNGLKYLASLDSRPTSLRIEGDSQLVLFVLTGRWNSKKPELTAYRDEQRALLSEMGLAWTANWIPREENEFCDSLT